MNAPDLRAAPPSASADEAERYRRLEREWQDGVGAELLDRPHLAAGSALVFRRQAERLIAQLDLGRPATVIEVGCGKGHFLERLGASAAAGSRLIGLDLSRAVASLPARRLLGVRADGEFLPFAGGVASCVVYDGALHHVIDYRAALREAIRVLAPGGTLLLFEPTSSWFNRLVHRLLDPIVFRRSAVYESPIDIRYKADFRHELIVAELERHGMTLRESRSDFLAYPLTGCYAGSFFARQERLMRRVVAVEDLISGLPLLGRLARLFAWRFTIVARKPGA